MREELVLAHEHAQSDQADMALRSHLQSGSVGRSEHNPATQREQHMTTENPTMEERGVKVKIEVTSDIRVTAFVARQNANMFILNHFGNLISAGESALQVTPEGLCWKVPIRCALPQAGMQTVGDLAIDVNTGEILLSQSTPSDLKTLHDFVEMAYAATKHPASPARNQ